MPYGYRKSGDKITVFKKDTGKVVGHTTPGKLKAYLAALHIHSKDTNESMILNKFKLAEFVKSFLEAEEEPVATTGEDPEADAPAGDAPAEGGEESTDTKKGGSADTLTVKFNMAKVRKYNNYPVIDNTGTVTGVSKNGLMVKVGDNTVLVNFEDLLD